jgi:ABC-type sugar transport system permease subunit
LTTTTARPGPTITTTPPPRVLIRRQTLLGILLVAPAILTILVVMFIPLVYAVVASLYDHPGADNATFVFLHNYARFFQDPVAIRSLINTAVYTALNLVLCLVLGVGMAVLLQSFPRRTGNFLRAFFSMPLLISPIIVGLIWRYMYDRQYGVVYWLLGLVGLDDSFGGLTSTKTALFSVVLADVWNVTPFILLVVSAGLTVIPEDLYEAARIDGAGALRTLFRITIPLLSKVLAVVIMIRGTDAFRTFDIIYALTNGGPAYATSSLSIYSYKQAFDNGELGFGMASSILTLIALVIIFGPLMRNSARERDPR